jgi:hypothetical protein
MSAPPPATTVLEPESFARALAQLIVVALTSYLPLVRLLQEIAAGAEDRERIDAAQALGSGLGLDLLAFVQAAELAAPAGEHDPGPVLALARSLGTSIAMAARVRSAATAAEAPLTPVSRLRALAEEPGARAWLAQRVAAMPEFVD